MKPSERRAQKELKAQKEAEELEALADTPEAKADKPKRRKKEKSILDDDVESMRKEGFIQSHVKLITFIICMAVFLGAATVIPLVHWLGERTVTGGEIPLELDDITAIAAKRQYISWDDFDNYIYTDQSAGDTRERVYMVSGTRFVVMVSGPKSDKKYPDTVMICDLDNTSYFLDLTKGGLDAFLAGAAKTPTKYLKADEVREFVSISLYIKWTDFSDYKYTQKTEVAPDKQSMDIIRMYIVEDARFSVWVYGESIVGEPDKILLVDNYDHDNFVDITSSSQAIAFIDKNS